MIDLKSMSDRIENPDHLFTQGAKDACHRAAGERSARPARREDLETQRKVSSHSPNHLTHLSQFMRFFSSFNWSIYLKIISD